MKTALIILIATILGFWTLHRTQAHPGVHFHCSVCGSHSHGSLWHDSDKDGVRDR